MSVSQKLRAALESAIRNGTTRYVISRDSGVDHAALSRFLAEGRDLRVSTVDSLAEYLGLELATKRAGIVPLPRQPAASMQCSTAFQQKRYSNPEIPLDRKETPQ